MTNQPGNSDQEIHYKFKVVLIGDFGVGKTNLLAQFTQNEFSPVSKLPVRLKPETMTHVINGKTIKSLIWDTAGEERYQSVTSSFYKGAVGAMIVYDITNSQSFDNVDRWLKELRDHANENVGIMLVGNKLDLGSTNRAVPTEHGEEFAKKENLSFMETSALDATNVESAFLKVLTDVTNKKLVLNDKDEPDDATVDIGLEPAPAQPEQNNKCCNIGSITIF